MTSRSGSSSGRNTFLWITSIAVVGALSITLLLLPRFPHPDDRAAPSPQVTLLGQPLPLTDATHKLALTRLRQFAATPFSLGLPENRVAELSLGRLGVQIDKLRLTTLVREAKDPTSTLRRVFEARRVPGATLVLPVPLVLSSEQAALELNRIKDQVDRTPGDARMDLEARTVRPETVGYLLDVDATTMAIERALLRGERRVDAVVATLQPKRLARELARVEFSSILGSFETRYDRSDKARDRTYNLRLAASRLDGHVLLPNEEFDFNEIVGPRDEPNGYKVATVIAEGELVDGVGGGTCQISGTLHGAVFFGGLQILERIPHTRPSSYIKMGLDATVVYPTINFRFRNPFEFPVVIHQTVKNGVVRAEILGPKHDQVTTMIRRITDIQPYEQLERPDEKLPRTTRILAQRGMPGFAVTRYRILRSGAHAVRERWLDRYPATPQIIRVGTLESPFSGKLPEDDRHGEYLADELLVMTQSTLTPDPNAVAEPDDATNEWREPGKSGRLGWTRELGMPQWEGSEREDTTPAENAGKPKTRARTPR
jgi:vancomycin resistance protein YoaR